MSGRGPHEFNPRNAGQIIAYYGLIAIVPIGGCP